MSESGIAEPQPHVTVAEPSDDMKLKLADREGHHQTAELCGDQKRLTFNVRSSVWLALQGTLVFCSTLAVP